MIAPKSETRLVSWQGEGGGQCKQDKFNISRSRLPQHYNRME